MTININWALVGSVFAALAGAAGTVLTPIYGSGLASGVQNVLQALSALAILIPTWHVSSVAAAKAKAVAEVRQAQAAQALADALERQVQAHQAIAAFAAPAA